MIYDAFLQQTTLVRFSGGITYDSNGFAVLPSYTLIPILSSMQPISKSSIKFLPEGTHYASFLEFLTDYPVQVDNNLTTLGDYFIYNNNKVYKIFSAQNYLPFSKLPPNHIEGLICRDNRITFNGSVLNIPFPEVDGAYAPLFELIAMVNSCFISPTITTLWSFQQELQPAFPYCTVTIENVSNVDNTNYMDSGTINISKQLIVKFSFYAYDMIQALNLREQFKLNYVNYTFNTTQFSFIGFVEEDNQIMNDLYEDRTIFNADVRMRFSWIVQETSTSSTIESTAFTLSVSP